MASYESSKRSITAFQGHFNRAEKAFNLLLKVKPRPTVETVEKLYARIQNQLYSLFTSLDDIIMLLENYDTNGKTLIEVEKELHKLNKYYGSLLSEQCYIERPRHLDRCTHPCKYVIFDFGTNYGNC